MDEQQPRWSRRTCTGHGDTVSVTTWWSHRYAGWLTQVVEHRDGVGYPLEYHVSTVEAQARDTHRDAVDRHPHTDGYRTLPRRVDAAGRCTRCGEVRRHGSRCRADLVSRYWLVPLPGWEGHEVVVGWDRRRGSFYAQVRAAAAGQLSEARDSDAAAGWVAVGVAGPAITDPQVMLDAVRPYGEIPDRLPADLAADPGRDVPRTASSPIDSSVVSGLLENLAMAKMAYAMRTGDLEGLVAVFDEMVEVGLVTTVAHVIAMMLEEIRQYIPTADREAAAAAGATFGIAITSTTGCYVAVDTDNALSIARVANSGPDTALARVGYRLATTHPQDALRWLRPGRLAVFTVHPLP